MSVSREMASRFFDTKTVLLQYLPRGQSAKPGISPQRHQPRTKESTKRIMLSRVGALIRQKELLRVRRNRHDAGVNVGLAPSAQGASTRSPEIPDDARVNVGVGPAHRTGSTAEQICPAQMKNSITALNFNCLPAQRAERHSRTFSRNRKRSYAV